MSRPLVIALVGVSQPGYRCLANAYLRESLMRDARLPPLAVATLEFDTTTDAWWVVYEICALDHPPDLVCFSVYCWNARIVYEALSLLAELDSSLPIVLGGPEVGPIADEIMARYPQVIQVVRGEGERAICDVVHALSRGGEYSLIAQRDPIAHLDDLPCPYTDTHPPATDGSAYLETFRGCPHRCAYCFEGKGTNKVRSFSWERIASDIERVATTPGMQSFSFVDSVFNLTKDRLQRLSDILAPYARKGLRLHTIEVDMESIDDEQAALLSRAGVVSVETGPQTIGEEALRLCHRTLDREAFMRGVEACKKVGIRVETDLIIGLAGDTVASVLQSFQFALHVDPGIIQASTLHVLPGTELWEKAGGLGLRFDANPPHEVIETPDLSYTDLRDLEVFSHALTTLYRARIEEDIVR